jgi:hypothetical protein
VRSNRRRSAQESVVWSRVPMLKENKLIGVIVIYRQQPG